MPITDLQIKNSKPKEKAYFLYDAEKIYIEIAPSGSKLWRIKYRFNGKERRTALFRKPEPNTYPEKSIKDARRRRDEIEDMLARGIDPSSGFGVGGGILFESVANEWWEFKKVHWREGYQRTQRMRLENYVLPHFKDRDINLIKRVDILNLLKGIERLKHYETTHKVLGILSGIFNYAAKTEIIELSPCTGLEEVLIPAKSKPLAAIVEPKKVGELLRAIDGYGGTFVVRAALLFSALTFCRPGEIAQAKWSEIDLPKALWTIPPEKAKMNKEHLVPLSRQSVALLEEVKALTGVYEYVFPNMRSPSRPMSNMTVLSALRQMGYTGQEMTAHGFRSMASTLLNEMGYNFDVVEAQLAHEGYDKIRAIYNRAEYMEERQKLMQGWADYLDTLQKTKE